LKCAPHKFVDYRDVIALCKITFVKRKLILVKDAMFLSVHEEVKSVQDSISEFQQSSHDMNVIEGVA